MLSSRGPEGPWRGRTPRHAPKSLSSRTASWVTFPRGSRRPCPSHTGSSEELPSRPWPSSTTEASSPAPSPQRISEETTTSLVRARLRPPRQRTRPATGLRETRHRAARLRQRSHVLRGLARCHRGAPKIATPRAPPRSEPVSPALESSPRASRRTPATRSRAGPSGGTVSARQERRLTPKGAASREPTSLTRCLEGTIRTALPGVSSPTTFVERGQPLAPSLPHPATVRLQVFSTS
jgi:hypothetical protein